MEKVLEKYSEKRKAVKFPLFSQILLLSFKDHHDQQFGILAGPNMGNV